MRKNSWIIALCVLLAVSCNQANNGEQKGENQYGPNPKEVEEMNN